MTHRLTKIAVSACPIIPAILRISSQSPGALIVVALAQWWKLPCFVSTHFSFSVTFHNAENSLFEG
jgi:hypothetical protein